MSEWLLLQAFLFTPSLPQSFVNMLVPLAAAALVLVGGALAAYVMVKFYGVVFLGRPREPNLAYAQRRRTVRARGARLVRRSAASLLGLFPGQPSSRSSIHVNAMLVGVDRRPAPAASWLLLAPIDCRPLELQPADRAAS